MIVKAFLKCGISSAMDESQDESVYEDDSEVEEDMTADDDSDVYKNDGEDYRHLLDQFDSDDDICDFEEFAA